jgi:hypothetical protein
MEFFKKMLTKKMLVYLDRSKPEILKIVHKQRYTLTEDDLEDAYQDALIELLDSNIEPPSSLEHLKQIFIKKILYQCYRELNQRRNDNNIKSGYTGMNLSHFERTMYPDEFIALLTPLQATLARCLNARMTYAEIDRHLNGKFSGSIGYMRAKYKSWLNRSPAKLSKEDKATLSGSNLDPRSIGIIERLLEGYSPAVVAKIFNMKVHSISNLKYMILKKLPHLRDLIPRRVSYKSSKKLESYSMQML